MQKRAFKKSKATAGGYKTAKTNENTYTDCEMETFQQQALEIRQPGENFDPTAVPKTGEEFLMKMLYERKQCPTVVVKRPKKLNAKAPNVMNLMKKDEEPKPSNDLPSKLLPTPEWKNVQAADFLATRAKINLLRQELTAHNYSNELEPPLTNNSLEWQQFCRQNQPLLSTILRINQRALEQLLDMMCEWLREGADPTADEEEQEQEVSTAESVTNESSQEEPHASSTTSAAAAAAEAKVAEEGSAALPLDLSTNHQWLGSWLYATLACLHLPLEPDTHSTLRDIARSCIRLRSHLTEQQLSSAVPCNLFICIISRVFDQLDLAEFI